MAIDDALGLACRRVTSSVTAPHTSRRGDRRRLPKRSSAVDSRCELRTRRALAGQRGECPSSWRFATGVCRFRDRSRRRPSAPSCRLSFALILARFLLVFEQPRLDLLGRIKRCPPYGNRARMDREPSGVCGEPPTIDFDWCDPRISGGSTSLTRREVPTRYRHIAHRARRIYQARISVRVREDTTDGGVPL